MSLRLKSYSLSVPLSTSAQDSIVSDWNRGNKVANLAERKKANDTFQRLRHALTTVIYAFLFTLVLGGSAEKVYCQVPGAASPGGPVSGETLLDEIINGGPPASWIPHSEKSWLRGLRVTGLLQNTTGTWVNPHGVRTNARPMRTNFYPAPFTGVPFYGPESATNFLATERNFMQVDTNFELNERNNFFLRFWGVYEPAYAFEQDFRSTAAQGLNAVGNRLGCFPPGIPGVVGASHCTASAASDFYNQLGFREAWWRLSIKPLRIFTGRQIVTWGESLAFRIADVVNPQDLSWNFGFANLEQSRLPQWMLHPILEIPDYGWATANFFEGIWEPPIQFTYDNWIWSDAPDHRYSGANGNGLSVNILAPNDGRFDVSGQTPFGGPVFSRRFAAYPQASFNSLFLPPSGDIRIAKYNMPTTQLRYSQEGIRFHTLIDQLIETTILYWHGHQYFPAARLNQVGPIQAFDGKPLDQVAFFFPQLNDIGFTANMPVNFPGRLGTILPFVLRAEGVWQDKTPFATRDPSNSSGFKYSDTINTLVALDADQIYAPWLTSTGSWTVNLEWNNYMILSPSRFMEYSPPTFQLARNREESFIFATNVGWWWDAIAPQWVMVYNPDGNTFLLFPNITLVPPWSKQYFMRLQYIGVISNNIQDTYAGGLFKGKNFILAQFQWNFNIF